MRGGDDRHGGRGGNRGGPDRHGGQGGGAARASPEPTFAADAWAPAKREYGLLHLLMCREAVAEELAKPKPPGRLKSLETRLCSPVLQPTRKDAPPPFSDDEDDCDSDASYISEGEPPEPSEPVSWGKGSRGAWWRVRTSLREDLVVRNGVSLLSAEVRRAAPGELLQQKGAPRVLAGGRAQGCIRMPIRPCGWVTADASRAGGPQYLIRTHAPRWRAVHQSTVEGAADVLVRSGPELDSEEVTSLHCGDIVEQVQPSVVRPDGIVRMPVSIVPGRRSEQREPDEDTGATKIRGWVTVDASAAGGPVFFKIVPEAQESPTNKGRRGRQPT